MKDANVVEHIERLEDQLQAVKWLVKRPRFVSRRGQPSTPSIVEETAGLLRGRVPSGVVYERRLRREWETRLRRRVH